MVDDPPSILLSFIYFLIVSVVTFLIPGLTALSRTRLSFFQKTVLAIVVGIALWAWQGFVFGFLGGRWLTYIYLAVFGLLFLKLYYIKLKKINLRRLALTKFDPVIVLLIGFGVMLQTSIVWLMGIRFSDGLYFCCGAIGDFMYHLRLTNEIIRQIPPYEPDMYGVVVRNYHYLGNIVVADLVRVFHLPLVFTQFQFMGILLSFLFGLSALVFAQLNKWSESPTRWLIFLLYFSGDFIYIIILLLGRGLDLSMGPLENGMALLNNPPRAYAIVAFFGGLSLLSYWTKKKDFLTGLVMALVFSSLISFKVYIGIYALCAVASLVIYYLYKRNFKMLLPLLLTIILSLSIYLPVNKDSGTLNFMGFWRFEEFIVQPALRLSHLELARQIFASHNNLVRVYLYDLFFMALFMFGMFGPKLIGLFQTKKSLKSLRPELHIFLIPSIFVSLIAGLFFWQSSGGSNSFNFLVSVYIIGSIYAAIGYSYWIGRFKKSIAIILIIAVVLLNLPRIAFEQWKNIKEISSKGGILVNDYDLSALKFVRDKTAPESLFISFDASYITFLAQRPLFLGQWGLLESHEIRTETRRNIVKDISEFRNPSEIQKLLKKNNITHLYLAYGEQTISTQSAGLLKTVFVNKFTKIMSLK